MEGVKDFFMLLYTQEVKAMANITSAGATVQLLMCENTTSQAESVFTTHRSVRYVCGTIRGIYTSALAPPKSYCDRIKLATLKCPFQTV